MNTQMLKKAAVTLVTAANQRRDSETTFIFSSLDVLRLTGLSLHDFDVRFNLMWELMELDRVNDCEVGPYEVEIEFAKEMIA